MKYFILFVVALHFCTLSPSVQATPSSAHVSVVSVLPVWPGKAQGGQNIGKSRAPEGSGIVLEPGLIATAWHVIEPATRIDVRLHDNRVLPAKLIAHDPKSDIAVLSVEEKLIPLKRRLSAELAEPVCALGNAYGLGISLTCGVVSALRVTHAGFNAIEDFVQTDAAINPGMSGGALVDREGYLVGMISAIFASDSDANIGINFAVSPALLFRVVDELISKGKVTYLSAGWQLGRADPEQLKRMAAPLVTQVQTESVAERAGLKEGDLIVSIGQRRTFTPRDAVMALALLPSHTQSVAIQLERAQQKMDLTLRFQDSPQKAQPKDCPHTVEICRVRQAVFPVRAFNPLASATRISENLLVTNRHVVGDHMQATVFTPNGERIARVIASAFKGDLVLLEVSGLPETGYILPLEDGLSPEEASAFYVVGADVSRQQVRVFRPGKLIAGPAKEAELSQLHVSAYMQPGTSGGALIDETGRLHGISVGGGEGRFRALPLSHIKRLVDLKNAPTAQSDHMALSQAYVTCANGLEQDRFAKENIAELSKVCAKANIYGQLLKAGRQFARSGQFEQAISLHSQAVQQVPHAINARLSLLVSLQLGGRFEEMVPHARWVMDRAGDDAGTLRFAIQSGIWGGAPEMAEEAYQRMLKINPQQAQAARRFIDSAPPAPPRR